MCKRDLLCSQIPNACISAPSESRHCNELAMLIMPICISTCFHLICAEHTCLSVLINCYSLRRVSDYSGRCACVW